VWIRMSPRAYLPHEGRRVPHVDHRIAHTPVALHTRPPQVHAHRHLLVLVMQEKKGRKESCVRSISFSYNMTHTPTGK
jgi:hypothetical protein